MVIALGSSCGMDGMRRLGGRRLQSGATASYVRGLGTRGCTGEIFMSSPPEELPGPKKDCMENLSGGEQVRNYQIKIPKLLDEEQKSVE